MGSCCHPWETQTPVRCWQEAWDPAPKRQRRGPGSHPSSPPALEEAALAWINTDPDDENEATGSLEGNTPSLFTG